MYSWYNVVSKAKKNPHFVMMLYRTIPPVNGLQYLVELLCARQARSYLLKTDATRMQVQQATSTPQTEVVRPITKNQVQATGNCLTLGAHVMYKTARQAVASSNSQKHFAR